MSRLETIMLVDDNPADNFYHSIIIEEANVASNIITFESPVHALDYLRNDKTHTVDLLFLDINMPELDGFEFIDRYKKVNGTASNIIIVMLTNSIRETDRNRALSSGIIRDFKIKPLTESYLAEIIKKHFP